MLIYINVDADGNVTDSLCGASVIPDKQYDYFFFKDEATAVNIMKFKVVLDGFKASLEIREGEFVPEPPPRKPSDIEIMRLEQAQANAEIIELIFGLMGGGV